MNGKFYSTLGEYRKLEQQVKEDAKSLIHKYLETYPEETFQNIKDKSQMGMLTEYANVEVYNSLTDVYDNCPLDSVELSSSGEFIFSTDDNSYTESEVRHVQTLIDLVIIMEDCIAIQE
jgi:hypothetical protein